MKTFSVSLYIVFSVALHCHCTCIADSMSMSPTEMYGDQGHYGDFELSFKAHCLLLSTNSEYAAEVGV